MNAQMLELLDLNTLSLMNAQFSKAYYEAHADGREADKEEAKKAARMVYNTGCKVAGSEENYRIWFELTNV